MVNRLTFIAFLHAIIMTNTQYTSVHQYSVIRTGINYGHYKAKLTHHSINIVNYIQCHYNNKATDFNRTHINTCSRIQSTHSISLYHSNLPFVLLIVNMQSQLLDLIHKSVRVRIVSDYYHTFQRHTAG